MLFKQLQPELLKKLLMNGSLLTGAATAGYFAPMMTGVSASVFVSAACATGGALVMLICFNIKLRKIVLALSAGALTGYFGGAGAAALVALTGMTAPLFIGASATAAAVTLPLLMTLENSWLGIATAALVAGYVGASVLPVASSIGFLFSIVCGFAGSSYLYPLMALGRLNKKIIAVGSAATAGYFAGTTAAASGMTLAGISPFVFLGACTIGGAVILPLMICLSKVVIEKLSSRKSSSLLLTKGFFPAVGGAAAGGYFAYKVAAASKVVTLMGVSAPVFVGACAAAGAVILPLLVYCCLSDNTVSQNNVKKLT